MKVHVYPADDGGCGHYRLIFPTEVLKAQGYDVDIFRHGSPGAVFNTMMQDTPDGDSNIVGMAENLDCDVVVLQRPIKKHLAQCIPFLQEQGKTVIVELDDDFANIHPQNAAWRTAQPRLNPDSNYRWLQMACQAADGVTVSTPGLRSFRRDAYVLPNYVPEWYTKVDIVPPTEPTTLGWSGSIDTHPNDLQQVGATMARLNRAGHPLQIVGTGKGVHKAFGIPTNTDVQATGWVGLDKAYPLAMAGIDVGIVPLALTKFNDAKSWLKGLEWAALGVPFVASPTAAYESLSRMGIGELAVKQKHWYPLLKNTRKDLGQEYRELVVANRMTYEEQSINWWDTWTAIHERNQ